MSIDSHKKQKRWRKEVAAFLFFMKLFMRFLYRAAVSWISRCARVRHRQK